MRRFYQADILRAIAVIMVLMYHFWVVCGYQSTGVGALNDLIGLSGEIGVTVFFILSGFGITCSLYSAESRGQKTAFLPFIKKRLARIYPLYIISMVFALLIGTMDAYGPADTVKSLILHIFFVHNLFAGHHGTISGVLWTMGVIFQFYLLSIPAYKLMKKSPRIFLAASVIFTVLIKVMIFCFFIAADESASLKYFIYGRQIFTAFDNFAIGMFAAYTVLNGKLPKIKAVPAAGLFLAAAVVFLVWCIVITPMSQIYLNGIWGWCWHSVTALLAGAVFLALLLNDINADGIIFLPFKFISRYEYGIYLFHLLIANLLAEVSPTFGKLAENYGCFALVMLFVSVSIGWLAEKIADGR